MSCSPCHFPIIQCRCHAGDTGMKEAPNNLNPFKYYHSLKSKDAVGSHIGC